MLGCCAPVLMPAGHIRAPCKRALPGHPLACGLRGRLHVACSAAPPQRTPSPVTLDDIKRQRLRFGDRPSRRGQQRHKEPGPGVWEQLHALQTPGEAAALMSTAWQSVVERTNDFVGRKVYQYFNWRQDTSKDLLVTFSVFSALVLVAGAVRRWAVDQPAERAVGNLWADVYQVCQWVFGQEFPGHDAPLGQQVLSVGTAIIGLAAFAMVLALVEQVVLEGLEANVKRGSKVFESGHILVLGWCKSQRDMEVVRKVVQQVCVAHAAEDGTTVVVMTQRSKLEMEAMFRRCLPECKRHGTKLVFRQGSPLVPSDLKLVGASRAAATIVVSDQSRSAAEADAQAVRCAILLDELDSDGADALWGRPYLTAMAAAATNDEGDDAAAHLDLSLLGRHVVVELKTANALPLLKYACSSRVMALPTSQLNAQRLAKMVKRPVISIISQQLFNFENENGVSVYVHYYPHLVGTRFGDLPYLFPDGIVMGLVDRATGKTRMAPSRDCYVQATHALVVCRPTSISSHGYVPLASPPSQQQLKLQEALTGWAGHPERALHGTESAAAAVLSAAKCTVGGQPTTSIGAGQQHAGLAVAAPLARLVGGTAGTSSRKSKQPTSARPSWSSAVSQVEVLRQQVEPCSRCADSQPSVASLKGVDAGVQQATVSNNIVPGPQLTAHRIAASHGLIEQGALVAAGAAQVAEAEVPVSMSTVPLTAGTGHSSSSSNSSPEGGGDSSNSSSSSSDGKGGALRTVDWPVLSGAHVRGDSWPMWQLPGITSQPHKHRQAKWQRRRLAAVTGVGNRPSAFAADSSVEGGLGFSVLPGPSRRSTHLPVGAVNDAAVLVPPEYFQVDECAEKVCVLGWGPNSLMLDLIKELDHGLSALPKGSEVVFINMHNPHDSLGQALQHVNLDNIQVRHVAANPLQRSSLAAALDVSTFRCALVLCDELWVDPDNNDANGLDSLDEPSVLRLDSLVMVAQLNMRKLLEDQRLPAINIICQKVATEGLTRFEDRHRLPLGISVNLNSFAAKMLAQIAANPLMLAPVTRLGEDAILTIVDSSCFAAQGEELNFWQLMARTQMVGDVLLGYYEIPEHLDEPLNTVVNPIGLQVRCTPRVWNQGDGRLKFILLCHKDYIHSSTSGSLDDRELVNTKQAGWVAARQRHQHSQHSHPNSWTDGQ